MLGQQCNHPDRDSVLVAYLYDDIDTADRVAFEVHVTGCERCRTELAEFRGVRSMLAQWGAPQSSGLSPLTSSPPSWWQRVPVWAQVAAAMLVLGVSAAIANVDIQYTHANGLTVRTGWSKSAARQATAPSSPEANAPWRAELAAMQQQLRNDIRAQVATLATTPAAASPARVAALASMSDDEFRRRVRVLLDESEQKQKKDFALQLVQLQQDMYAQRQADLSRLYQTIGLFQSSTHNELASQRQVLNMAVSRRP